MNTKTKHTLIKKQDKHVYENKTIKYTKTKHAWIRNQNTHEYENKTHVNKSPTDHPLLFIKMPIYYKNHNKYFTNRLKMVSLLNQF